MNRSCGEARRRTTRSWCISRARGCSAKATSAAAPRSPCVMYLDRPIDDGAASVPPERRSVKAYRSALSRMSAGVADAGRSTHWHSSANYPCRSASPRSARRSRRCRPPAVTPAVRYATRSILGRRIGSFGSSSDGPQLRTQGYSSGEGLEDHRFDGVGLAVIALQVITSSSSAREVTQAELPTFNALPNLLASKALPLRFQIKSENGAGCRALGCGQGGIPGARSTGHRWPSAARGLGAALSTVHHAVSRGPPRGARGCGVTTCSLVRRARGSEVLLEERGDAVSRRARWRGVHVVSEVLLV